MVILQKIALIFTIIGAINWGLVGFFDFNLVTAIFGNATVMVRIIYAIIGIAGIVNIGLLIQDFDEK